MPHYDYQCLKCNHVFEVFHKITESPDLECPKCGAQVKRLFGGGAGIIFKGSGFYKTDYSNSKPKEAPQCSCSAKN
ncbi:MAG: FmdB family zinc ribbon protein [Brevinematia bacterium]